MIVGVPREIKNDENRVSMTPAGVSAFIRKGHEVLVEKGAGLGSGFGDGDYEKEGARILPDARDIFGRSGMIIKVKEPQPAEVAMLKEGQVLYTYLHLAPDYELTRGLMERKVIAVAYETMEAGESWSSWSP